MPLVPSLNIYIWKLLNKDLSFLVFHKESNPTNDVRQKFVFFTKNAKEVICVSAVASWPWRDVARFATQSNVSL